MAITAISTDYTGRKVDLSIFPDQLLPNRAVTAGVGERGVFSRAVAGPAKAAQNYGRLLLTPLGAERSRPGAGSRLRERVNTGAIRYGPDLAQAFAAENLRVLTYLDSVSRDKPDDERIASAELAGSDVSPGGITMRIALTMRSGEKTTFLLPVAWSV